jgi:hypothetical protein
MISMSFYFESCMIRLRNSIKFCANLGKMCDAEPGNGYRSVRGRKPKQYKDSLNSSRPKKDRQVKSKVKSMLIISFDFKGFIRIRHGRPNSQIIILLWPFTATTWKCAKTSPRTLAAKELAVCITITHHLTLHFPTVKCSTKTTWLSSPTNPTGLTLPPATFMFPQLNDRHFDTLKLYQNGGVEHLHRTQLPACI